MSDRDREHKSTPVDFYDEALGCCGFIVLIFLLFIVPPFAYMAISWLLGKL